MHDRAVFIDFENIQKVDLAEVPPTVRVLVFFGASQKSVTRDYHKLALKLGERCVEIDMHRHGKNALDFHIAFYLGECLAKTPGAELVVLSKDKDYDPLIEHLRGRKFNVRRESSLADAFKSKAGDPPGEPRLDRMLDWLRKMEKKARPRKRTGLIAHVGSCFKEATSGDIKRLVDQLFADGHVSESNGMLVYKL